MLIAGEVNDERGYLLSADPAFLAEFTDKQLQVETPLGLVTADAPPAAQKAGHRRGYA